MRFDLEHVRPLLLAAALAPAIGCSAIVGYPCEQGYVACGIQCVDLATDSQHCGGCGISCASHVCIAGQCAAVGDAQIGDASLPTMTDGGMPMADARVDAGMDDGGSATLTGDAAMDDGGGTTTDDASTMAMLDGGAVDPDAGATSDVDGGSAGSDDAGDPDGGTLVCDVGELSCAGACVLAGSDPENCGVCGYTCPGDMSCRGGGCVFACDASETACGRGCVDTTNDPNHCGGCDIECATGICVDSMCVSGYAGHLVMIGHDYAEARPAEELLLLHAIELGAARFPRVLRYIGDRDSAVVAALDGTLGRLGIAPAVVTDYTEVPLRLADADVFVVDAQHEADDAALVALGTAWSRALDTFLGRGGVVVALDALTVPPTAGASGWMSAAGLVDPTDRSDAFGDVVHVVAPSDGLVIGIPLSYRASAASVQWGMPTLPVVIAGATGAVVLHRTVVPM